MKHTYGRMDTSVGHVFKTFEAHVGVPEGTLFEYVSKEDWTEEYQRRFVDGNRAGKSRAGDIEAEFHLSGEYPDWWEGVRMGGNEK